METDHILGCVYKSREESPVVGYLDPKRVSPSFRVPLNSLSFFTFFFYSSKHLCRIRTDSIIIQISL